MSEDGKNMTEYERPEAIPALDLALHIWLEYFVSTETFDRSLPGCFWRDEDVWMPDPSHRMISLAYARQRKSKALRALSLAHIDEKTSEKARDLACRMPLGEAQRAIAKDWPLVK